jgi:hypothetical protein
LLGLVDGCEGDVHRRGGGITYSAGGAQKVAVAAGFTNILWSTKLVAGKMVILGLPGA